MLGHQSTYVDHLIEVVESQAIDVVLIAGDVYDRALPSVDAVALADEAFARLAASRARVVVTSGNHDSAERLGFASRLIDAAGVHVRSRLSEVGTPVLLHDAHGPVACYGIPYLDPESTRSTWELPVRSHEASLTAAMQRIRSDLAVRHTQARTRSIVLAHAFVAGGAPSESERDIAVGGVDRVPITTLDGIDYVALGHLHRPQVLTDRVRYSGSPLAYSFSEAGQVKGSWLIDLGAGGEVTSEFLPAPLPRPLSCIRGRLDELLSRPELSASSDHWVHATLTDPLRPRAAMEQLRSRFPHTLVLAFEPEGATPHPAGLPRDSTLSGRSDLGTTLDFVAHVRGVPASAAESALLDEACTCVRATSEAT